VLCENKDNPEKQGCDGKCHLKKQLDQQKPIEDKRPFSNSTTPVFYPDLLAVFLCIEEQKNQDLELNTLKIPQNHISTNEFIGDIFRPPES
jgi:hypothetical protein